MQGEGSCSFFEAKGAAAFRGSEMLRRYQLSAITGKHKSSLNPQSKSPGYVYIFSPSLGRAAAAATSTIVNQSLSGGGLLGSGESADCRGGGSIKDWAGVARKTPRYIVIHE